MIFGLFKKEEVADIIFTGGKIYTQDPDAPWAEAVACKDGKIMAVGDADIIAELESDDTEVVDLEGGVLLPGFIDSCAHPVLQAFNDSCLILDYAMTIYDVLDALTEYVANHPDHPAYFAYGFRLDILSDISQEKAQSLLDKIAQDKPIALLDASGVQGWFNSIATKIATEAAEEDKISMVTLPYILHTIMPIDFERFQKSVIEAAFEYSARGFTGLFDCGAPDYMHAVYQDVLLEMLQTDMLKQRFFGSLLINRNVDPESLMRKLMQKKTNCAELNNLINFQTLKIIIDDSGNAASITPDMLKILCIQASDKGFDLHIDAVGKAAISDAFEAVFLTRAAGYRRNHVTLAHSYGLSQEEKTELLLDNDLCETVSTLGDFTKKYRGMESAKDVVDAIDKLTIEAASQLGISDYYGSIEADKYADFVIFDQNPLDCNLARLRDLTAAMTVINGKIVYDAKEDSLARWSDILTASYEQALSEV